MSSVGAIPDRQQRELAETTFDRNVVVVAGAGTGKTTLLVNRLLHLLMKEPDPVPVTRLVALTFTNKAATEMKVRLRDRLWGLVRPEAEPARPADGGAVSAQDLRGRYHLSAETLAARAEAALQDLDKAQIGTLHSFAAHLLRLHPLESGVDPAFQEDDGSRFDEHFTAAWDLWVDRELSRRGAHHGLWRGLLRHVMVEDLRAFARALCSELVDPVLLHEQLEKPGCEPLAVEWLTELRNQAQRLLAAHDRPKRRKIEQMLAATLALLERLLDQGPSALPTWPLEERAVLAKDVGTQVAGWEPDDFQEATRLIETAKACLEVDAHFFKQALSLVLPFVMEVRHAFVQQGWLSFDGLLVRARRLLREHPAVRERIKQDYRAILVDEFQDTDPVQYEIILAVAERLGTQAADWKDMALEPGKLFIVGDPKQSIYAFRRADIEAFDRVVEKIAADHGTIHTLTTNFRSDAAVLEPVNDLFDRVFEQRPRVQPANVRLAVRPNRRPASVDPGVRLHVVGPSGAEPFDSMEATRAEAEALAQWLREDLLAGPAMKPGHVALLFRKLTQAEVYLDALRRHGLSYVIEGEKHFYRRQEVIDLINLLRVLDNPHDAIALAGVLRGPLGGLTDRELYDVRRAGWFDYREFRRLEAASQPYAAPVRRLYEQLDALHRDIAALPLADAIQRIFDQVPLLDLAAASLHGEQAVANLLKAKHTAAALAERPHLTLSRFVELMVGRLDEQPDEAESPLVEESQEAIQVLTIHKAKGLEFPVVVLPGLHQGQGNGGERSLPVVSYDWSSGTYGLSLGGRRTFGSVLIQEKSSWREEAERRRVLYVGMTRAKELLVLSGGLTARAHRDTVLSLLQEVAEGEVGAASTSALTIGRSTIPHRLVTAPERKRPRRREAADTTGPPIDTASLAALWRRRAEAWTEARGTADHLTPTLMAKDGIPARRSRAAAGAEADIGRLTGVLAHRILEQWNFADDPARFDERIAEAIAGSPAAEDESTATALTASLRELLGGFGRSALYARLRGATILGREIPFVIPWGEGAGTQVMEGVLDVLYRLDGHLWIADYKTDAVTADQAAAHAERYRRQSDIYKAAVMQSGATASVRFHCLFLRCATAVEL